MLRKNQYLACLADPILAKPVGVPDAVAGQSLVSKQYNEFEAEFDGNGESSLVLMPFIDNCIFTRRLYNVTMRSPQWRAFLAQFGAPFLDGQMMVVPPEYLGTMGAQEMELSATKVVAGFPTCYTGSADGRNMAPELRFDGALGGAPPIAKTYARFPGAVVAAGATVNIVGRNTPNTALTANVYIVTTNSTVITYTAAAAAVSIISISGSVVVPAGHTHILEWGFVRTAGAATISEASMEVTSTTEHFQQVPIGDNFENVLTASDHGVQARLVSAAAMFTYTGNQLENGRIRGAILTEPISPFSAEVEGDELLLRRESGTKQLVDGMTVHWLPFLDSDSNFHATNASQRHAARNEPLDCTKVRIQALANNAAGQSGRWRVWTNWEIKTLNRSFMTKPMRVNLAELADARNKVFQPSFPLITGNDGHAAAIGKFLQKFGTIVEVSAGLLSALLGPEFLPAAAVGEGIRQIGGVLNDDDASDGRTARLAQKLPVVRAVRTVAPKSKRSAGKGKQRR